MDTIILSAFLFVAQRAGGKAARPAPQGNMLVSLFLIFGLLVIFYLLIILPQRIKQKKQMEKADNLNEVTDPSSISRINCGQICPKCPKDRIGRWVYAVRGPESKVVQYHNWCGYYEIREDLEWDSLVKQYISAGAIRWPDKNQLILPSDLPPNTLKEIYKKRERVSFKTPIILLAIFLFFVVVLFIRKSMKENTGENTSFIKAESRRSYIENIKPLTITNEPTKAKRAAWEEFVEVTGQETEGKIVSVPEPGRYEIDYIEGIIYDTSEDKMRKAAYDIWGSDYDPEWKDYFVYSDTPGVKAVEALLIVDGEVGSANGKVCQFPDNERSVSIYIDKYVCFFRHEPFKEDINGNIYHGFQNNSGYWRFKISRKALD